MKPENNNQLLLTMEEGYQRGVKELSEGPKPSYLVVSKKEKDLLTNLSNPSNIMSELTTLQQKYYLTNNSELDWTLCTCHNSNECVKHPEWVEEFKKL